MPPLPPTPPIRSRRAAQVARLFGLIARDPAPAGALGAPPAEALAQLPGPGQILLITGPSGAGKSCLLRALQADAFARGQRCADLQTLRPPPRPVVDCFGRLPLPPTLALLARFGLAEATTYLRTPDELSEGQRYRLRLAIALHHATRNPNRSGLPALLIADEFTASLDRVTAAVVARALRRAVSATCNLSAIVATAHDDLLTALQPDRVVECDFEQAECRPPETQPPTPDTRHPKP